MQQHNQQHPLLLLVRRYQGIHPAVAVTADVALTLWTAAAGTCVLPLLLGSETLVELPGRTDDNHWCQLWRDVAAQMDSQQIYQVRHSEGQRWGGGVTYHSNLA